MSSVSAGGGEVACESAVAIAEEPQQDAAQNRAHQDQVGAGRECDPVDDLGVRVIEGRDGAVVHPTPGGVNDPLDSGEPSGDDGDSAASLAATDEVVT